MPWKTPSTISSDPPPFWLGCAVWAFADWVGSFYPPGTPSRDYLRCYGDRLTAVEGNTTFYAIPGPELVARWCDEMPQRFRFCPKLHRSISHDHPLATGLDDAAAFLERLQPLGDRLGPLLLQLSPRYGPDRFDDLERFLRGWGDRHPLSLEVRHPDWYDAAPAARLNDLLGEQGLGRAILDTRPIYSGPDDPQVHSRNRKPCLPLASTLTSGYALVRLITHPHSPRNLSYRQEWAERLQRWRSEGIEIFCFVHCPDERCSPANLIDLQTALTALDPNWPALPQPALPEQQLTLSLEAPVS
mgnify:CR=1 FL=1